ncbi:unnamed protein product [Gordionus sp. m RMFG-2023]|uniref:ubiquitin-conjugating enzyme E2 K-like n=1 Tax=Gordionus sp. m RMFG-2023 TaxID=3053472 RepID=UPI0030DFC9C0
MVDNTIALARIRREFREVLKSEETQDCIHIELVNDNFMELQGQISGPPDTPYEGAVYHLEIKIPDTYPFHPPKVKFLTKIWHPNISSATGAICLDILKDQWAAAMNLRVVLLSIQALLSAAEPDDPQDAVVAQQYKSNPDIFRITARYWAHVYAHGPDGNHSELEEKVKILSEMGIEKNQARFALSSSSWDVSAAMEHLFS